MPMDCNFFISITVVVLCVCLCLCVFVCFCVFRTDPPVFGQNKHNVITGMIMEN